MKYTLSAALVSVAAVVSSTSSQAGGIDFRLGSETAELTYLTESATFGYGGADIGYGLFIDEDDDFVGSASILVSGSGTGDVRGLHYGVGAKAYLGFLDNRNDDKGGALAIGGQIRYVFPSSMPLAVLAEGFAAPGVTSIADFDGITEYRFAIELEVTPSARAYIGYRFLEVELDTGAEIELDDKGHVGVRFSF